MILLLPIIFYLLLYLPFIGVTPYYDGAKEFRFAYNVYSGQYLSNWIPFHPPFKLLLSALFFHLWGYGSYTYLGLILGILGIIAMYGIGKKLFDRKTGFWSSLFLATSGLYISTGMFSITDFVLTVLILSAFYFYLHEKYWRYSMLASCAVITKEPGLLFPLSILLGNMLLKKKMKVLFLFPLVIFQAWLWFLQLTGHQAWNDWNFSNMAKQGSVMTVLHNLVTFQFLNRYAYENWKHLFLFNFNWIFSFFATLGVRRILLQRREKNNHHPFLILLIFFCSYVIAVLSFQTFPITRYTLPMLPFLYLFAAFGISKLKWSYLFFACITMVIMFALFHSNDPVSNFLWKKQSKLGEKVYISELGGPDAITYNLQFLVIASTRDKQIHQGNCKINYSQLEYRQLLFSLLHIPRCSNLEKSR